MSYFEKVQKVRSKCAIAMVFLVNIGFIESIKNLKKSKMKECGAGFWVLEGFGGQRKGGVWCYIKRSVDFEVFEGLID